MRKLKTIIPVLLMAVLLTSCINEDDPVPAEDIYQIYYYEYLAYEDESYARASFREGEIAGKQVELDDNATLTVNGNTMVYKENTGSFPYSASFKGRPASLEFYYKNEDGKEFVNSLYKADIDSIAFRAVNHTTSFQEDYVLHWKGAAVGEGERVVVNVDTEGSGFQEFQQTKKDASTITLPKSDLMQLGPGEHDMHIHRYKEMEIDDVSAVGGLAVYTYSSDKGILKIEQ
ncbi:MAG: hypothetical protein K9I94_05730 [Bacteroidales bacterium]|nr:hypothetical protein [Bacteroidales bacterium]